MKVVMTAFAGQQIRQIARYIGKEFSKKYRKEFLNKIKETRQLLAANPNLGLAEPLLSDYPKTYRSLVVTRLNKMIYYIDGSTIFIVDFWDVRREPSTLANQVK